MEYTLNDAFQTLTDIHAARIREIEDLRGVLSENHPITFKNAIASLEIRKKQHKFCQNLLNQIFKEEPKDYPVLMTSDLYIEVLKELQEEVQSAKELFESIEKQLSFIKDDINYLENKKNGLEKMKCAYLDYTEMVNNASHINEYVILKRMFHNVKADLHSVINILFPNNDNLIKFLGILSSSYIKGGDDLYVDVTPDVLDFSNFLIEADIITYHRNDKNKVKLMDML